MSELRNILEGYVAENLSVLPDEEDPMTGFGAGERVRINDDDPVFGGEEGVVQAIGRDNSGALLADVLIDGTSDAHRVDIEMVEIA